MIEHAKKTFLFLSLSCMMTGCPSGGSNGTTSTNPTPTPSPTATPTPTATPNPDYCGGMGTEFFPYLICDQRSLQNISINLNSHFRLNSNITISGTFTPIFSFRGELNGANYSITGLNVANYFISDNYGTIKNIQFNNLTVSGTGQWTGLVRANRGAIADVSITNGMISSTNSGASSAIGGIAGYNSGGSTLTRISFQGTVSSTTVSQIGGIVGFNEGLFSVSTIGSISNATLKSGSTVEGIFNSSQTQYIGGIVGWNSGTISLSVTEASSIVSSGDRNGGIVGYQAFSNFAKVESSTNNSTVSSAKPLSISGGIAGTASGQISKVRNNGQITTSYYRGGILGSGSADIQYCLNTGEITSGGTHRGGVVAKLDSGGSLNQCLNVGTVGGNNNPTTSYGGALIGQNDGAITESYFSADATHPGGGVGFGDATGFASLNTANLANANSFTNWDFVNVWQLVAIHPTLR